MPNPFDGDPILVEVMRGGYLESVHRGRVAITDPDGRLACSVGAEFAPLYPRSALKPLQAVGMLRAGLDLDGELLALVCASHSGEPQHLAGVREILDRGGLNEAVLQTPPDWPLDESSREEAIRAGRPKAAIASNCSGKHAGMIRTAQLRGDDLASYRDPDHPVQLAVVSTIDDLAAEQAGNLAVDGCGAPAYSISLYALARAYGRLAQARDGAEATVAAAIRASPEYVSGSRRDELELHRAVPGLIAKAGAEATYAVGLPDGRGVAIKISDGTPRARAVAMAGVLQRLGFDHELLTAQASAPVLSGGTRVGEIRPCAETLAKLGG
ncbi:MAG TPA: asparaginase [Propionibacteriaceae bacterium]|nr:asparaginase [Propionibacteriaceae bacterium]